MLSIQMEIQRYRASQGYTSIVRLLLDRKASIDAVNSNGNTALYFAAVQGHTATVELLMRGASTDAKR